MRVLLLENISESARFFFESKGLQVTSYPEAWSEENLVHKLGDYDLLGIRSKTEISAKVLQSNPHLLAVGCFCIGTNQVDIKTAKSLAIPVFNAPYANTRSVAELVIAEIIALSRHLTDRSCQMHSGEWNKSAKGSREIRGKTLGIVGYGHIGSQVSILAEALGMRVLFFDIVKKLPLGNAKPVETLEVLLRESDFVTLHVPLTPLTQNMINTETLKLMKKGAYLLNLSRGPVVDLDSLANFLKNEWLAGAAIDVFPEEPRSNSQSFKCVLQGLKNVILTPHVGGSTEEAQDRIGEEVSRTLYEYVKRGSTMGAVNVPRADLMEPDMEGRKSPVYRLTNFHRNEPGALGALTQAIAQNGGNICGQTLVTDSEMGYVILDIEINQPVLLEQLSFSSSLRTRWVK